jgi:hypothetical protein
VSNAFTQRALQVRWDYIEDHWHAEEVLGEAGAQFVKTHSVCTSNHELVVAMTLLTGMAPLTNGATVSIFPGHVSPLNVMSVLVGYPQTRKSQMTKLLKTIGDSLDEHMLSVAKQRIQAGADDEAGDEPTDVPPPKIFMTSCVLASFTPAVLFERCSGDFVFVQNTDDFPAVNWKEPLFMGRLANVDEVYAIFQELGLVQDDSRRRSGASAGSAVNPHAGVFNRFLQFGECKGHADIRQLRGSRCAPCFFRFRRKYAPRDRGPDGTRRHRQSHGGDQRAHLIFWSASSSATFCLAGWVQTA